MKVVLLAVVVTDKPSLKVCLIFATLLACSVSQRKNHQNLKINLVN